MPQMASVSKYISKHSTLKYSSWIYAAGPDALFPSPPMQNTMQFMAALNAVKVEEMTKSDAFFSPHLETTRNERVLSYSEN